MLLSRLTPETAFYFPGYQEQEPQDRMTTNLAKVFLKGKTRSTGTFSKRDRYDAQLSGTQNPSTSQRCFFSDAYAVAPPI